MYTSMSMLIPTGHIPMNTNKKRGFPLSSLVVNFVYFMSKNILNIECRILNDEYRSKIFYHFYSYKKIERSDSILRHSKFFIRYSIFVLLSSLCQSGNFLLYCYSDLVQDSQYQKAYGPYPEGNKNFGYCRDIFINMMQRVRYKPA